jgi:hypothetical protein
MGRTRRALSLTNRVFGQRSSATLLLSVIVSLVVVACGDEASSSSPIDSGPLPSGVPSETMAAERTIEPLATGDMAIGPCAPVTDLQDRLAGLVEVELRLPNRVTLDIELGKVQSAFAELRRVDLGPLEAQLEDPLRRLGYRLIDLEIAVEDFRTTSRPRPAAAHVEEDSTAFGDAVAGFAILARC